MEHLFNQERFYQRINFQDFPAMATDIDGLIHVKGQCWLWLEAKYEGTGLPLGQEILAKDLVKSLGKEAPAFFVVAHHDTKPSEEITGENLLVSKVYASAPHLKGKIVEHIYEHRPSWSNFASDALLHNNGYRVLKPIPILGEGRESGDILTKTDEYLWRAVENEHLMHEYADLDCVDREDMSPELWEFLVSFGFAELEGGDGETNTVLMFDGLVFSNWLQNRHLIT